MRKGHLRSIQCLVQIPETKILCLGQSKLPLLPHNHVPRLVFTAPAEPTLGSREDTFKLLTFLCGYSNHCVPLTLPLLGWTLERQKDEDLRKAGVLPGELFACLGLAEGSKQFLTMHPDKSLEKSHIPSHHPASSGPPEPLTPPSQRSLQGPP